MAKGQTILLLLAAVALTWPSSEAAWGTTFVLMDDQQLFQTSDVVVVGTVTAIESGEGANGAIQTYVHVQPSRVIKGDIGKDALVIREPGGSIGDRREWVYGAPEFWVGERNLLFLSRNADGTLQTNSLSMGKFTLGIDGSGQSTVARDFGYGASVLDSVTGEARAAPLETQAFLPLLTRLRLMTQSSAGDGQRAPLVLRPQELDTTPTETHESFTFLGSPIRWFEPDSGQAVTYYVDSTGDSKLGPDSSRAVVDAALAAWTSVPTSSLTLVDGGTTAPGPFAQCGINRIVFNDPYNEIPNPAGCSGILAMGGFCTIGQTTVVNSTTFSRIVVGKVTFNDGWSGCSGWNQCNLAEVATHEIGHTIGLGHSADSAATMRASAHFDGRCAGLATDDMNGVTFIYPGPADPTPTATPSPPTNTPPADATPSPTNAPTNTPSPTRPPTNTPLPTATFTRTPTRTQTPTFTSTPTFTPPPIHDSVVDALRPLNLAIASGRTAVTTKVRVKVTNADVEPLPETPGHTIRLAAASGDCPSGTVVGLPDFDGDTAGDQDTVQLAGGKSKSAVVTLTVDGAAFALLHQAAPMRCTLTFTASVVQPAGSSDPSPANNVASLELNVVDRNAGGGAAQPLLKSITPVKLKIPRGATSVTTKIQPRLGLNADGVPLSQTGTLIVSASDCPADMVNAVNPAPASGSSRRVSKMSVAVTINGAAVFTPHDKCPARCSATLTVGGAGIDQADASRGSRLVIDVIDKNDF